MTRRNVQKGVRAGTLKLVGTDPVCVKEAMTELLTDETVYRQMSQAPNPYGDGNASERIVQTIKHYFGFAESASEFQERS